jgi:hypothetical protein
MAYVIAPNGSKEVTVLNTYKLAAFSNDEYKIYQKVGYPNHPDTWVLYKEATAGESYLSAAMTADTVFRIEVGSLELWYETGTAPSIAEPQTDITAADATFTIDGLAAAQGGYVYVRGGTSSTAANAGGEVKLQGGQPGATGVGGAATVVGGIGGATSGAGGDVTVTGGAGTAGNGAGGSVILAGGAPHGSGLAGGVFNRGTYQFRKQAAQVDKADGNQSVTGAQLINGICVHTVTTGRSLTTPTGAQILAACPADIAAGDSFDFTLITLGSGADDISTLTAGDGDVTIVGEPTVGPQGSTFNNYGTFRFRYAGANAFVAYRVG